MADHNEWLDLEQTRLQLEAYARDLRASYGRELRRARELELTSMATVRALATAVEAKDGYTGGHLQRVHAMGLLLAEAVAPDQADDPQLAYGFLLHDVGKLSVPDSVLGKRGRLTDEEWTHIRRHPEAGVHILAGVPFLDRAMDVVMHHHERWDGSGYPDALSEERIPLWARIFAVVDAFDAMTSDRPYRDRMSMDAAVEEIVRHAGAQFDPMCADALAALDRDELSALMAPRPVSFAGSRRS